MASPHQRPRTAARYLAAAHLERIIADMDVHGVRPTVQNIVAAATDLNIVQPALGLIARMANQRLQPKQEN